MPVAANSNCHPFNTTASRGHIWCSSCLLYSSHKSCCLHLLSLFLSVWNPRECVSGRHLDGNHYVTHTHREKVKEVGGFCAWAEGSLDLQGRLCPQHKVTNVEQKPRGHFCSFAALENKVAPFPRQKRDADSRRPITQMSGWLCQTDSARGVPCGSYSCYYLKFLKGSSEKKPLKF